MAHSKVTATGKYHYPESTKINALITRVTSPCRRNSLVFYCTERPKNAEESTEKRELK